VAGTRSAPRVEPASLITKSTRPNSASTRSASCSTCIASRTSDTSGKARRPSARTSSATESMSRQPARC